MLVELKTDETELTERLAVNSQKGGSQKRYWEDDEHERFLVGLAKYGLLWLWLG
jgi:hypothetical protein